MRTTYTKARGRADKLEVFLGEDKKWRYRGRSANGRKLFVSQSYSSRSNARRAALDRQKKQGGEVVMIAGRER